MKTKFQILFMVAALFLVPSCDQKMESTQNPTTDVIGSERENYTLILTIDGGGVKGIVPATILAQLEHDLGKPIYQMFDVIGGTSTGGIISVGLTTPRLPSRTEATRPRTAAEIQNIYLQNCNDILVPVKHELGPYYYANSGGRNPVGIELYLQGLVGKSYTMKQAYDNMIALPNSRVREVFTTCYIVNSDGGKQTVAQKGLNYGPYQFTWSNAIDATKNENYYAWEAARGTSAAPTFFPIAQVGGNNNNDPLNVRSNSQERWVIDGGVVTNNPIITGIDILRKNNVNLKNVVAVSLGCGINPFNGGVGVTNQAINNYQPYGQKYGFWNTANWVAEDLYNLNEEKAGRGRLIELLMFANQFTADNQLENLIQTGGIEAGLRLQPILPQNINDSFNCNMVTLLQEATINYITTNPNGIKEYAALKALLRKYL